MNRKQTITFCSDRYQPFIEELTNVLCSVLYLYLYILCFMISWWCDHLIRQEKFTYLSFCCYISGHSCHIQFTFHLHCSSLRYDNLDFTLCDFWRHQVWLAWCTSVFSIEANKAVSVISFRHHFPVSHSVDGAGSQPAEQQNQSTMWVSKTTFSLMTASGVCKPQLKARSVFFLLVWAIMVWGCSCLLRTDGGLWNQ